MRAELVSMMFLSGLVACSSFAVVFAGLVLTHTAVFSCTIKTTQIFSNVMGDRKIISEGSLHFQQYLTGGVGYYDGRLQLNDISLAKTEFVNITFETEYRRIGKMLRLKTNFLSGDNTDNFSGMTYGTLISPYLKKDAINHISLGYSRSFGYTAGSFSSPFFICN